MALHAKAQEKRIKRSRQARADPPAGNADLVLRQSGGNAGMGDCTEHTVCTLGNSDVAGYVETGWTGAQKALACPTVG